MPQIQINQNLLARAVKGLKLNVPLYGARQLEDGSVEITSRHGVQVWTPPKPRKKRTSTNLPKGK